MTNLSIKNWIKYKPSVGVEQAHMIGYPGTGKSNMSAGLYQKCLQRGEGLVMPGDRFCEWRHYPYHPQFPCKMTVIIPKGVELFYYPDQEQVQQLGEWVEKDYNNLDVFEFLDDDYRLLVIYDQHLRLASRTALWANIITQLLNRDPSILKQKAIGMLFHEAGILFPQNAIGQQWRAVDEFSERFVECRKGLVRIMLVSQIDTEIESTIRGKAMYGIIRKATLNKSWPQLLRKVSPFTPINQYQLCLGKGLYLLDNNVEEFYEKKIIFKMVPTQLIDQGLDSQTAADIYPTVFLCDKCSHKWLPLVEKPAKCPKCSKRFRYPQEVKEIEQYMESRQS
ncbi:MAG: hypothetical protein ACXACR_02510 [Candidatus Hodarchaeales archaeon]|jgi:hypothetical protein